jgi:hypothetical protein
VRLSVVSAALPWSLFFFVLAIVGVVISVITFIFALIFFIILTIFYILFLSFVAEIDFQ